MRAVLVSVDYGDLLEHTLAYNRHHFEEVMVVTTPADQRSISAALANSAQLYVTEEFYDHGAVFNKWRALESGLDLFGRHGLLCVMDADVLWPKIIPAIDFKCGILYTPHRRMMFDFRGQIPAEETWIDFPMHPENEFPGYSQIFYADDPHLGHPPWHETNWKHAGGADSYFQRKWPDTNKVRPPFQVLHLGEAGKNWCGRVTPYTDGSSDPKCAERRNLLNKFLRFRKPGPARHKHEKF